MTKKVFLSYARINKHEARALYNDLLDPRIDLWFDEEDLLPGIKWRPATCMN